ncbi:MAG: SPOR domain-containing protein [Alloprevotella sp.]|nr:SPOR domain-containing protein [Alloprevotella sp.]
MKKIFIAVLGLTAAFALTSCKSQESAYRKAYLQAQANQQQAQTNTTTVAVPTDNYDDEDVSVTPVTSPTQPATTRVNPSTSAEVDAAPVRTYDGGHSVVSGSQLKAYSVVVGSFTVQANAEGLCQQLRNAGYDARVAKANTPINGQTWYRVVASSYDSKASAVQSRNELKSRYADAWLLYNK